MAMNREQLSELLSAYVDGEVTANERAVVEGALRTDPQARQLLEELRRTAAAVSALPRHAAPASLAVDLDAQLERAQLLSGFGRRAEGRSGWGKWQTPLKAAAMLAVVAGAGWWFAFGPGSQTPGEKIADATKPVSVEESTSSSAALLTTASRESGMDIESRLAAGEDPVVLVNHSFEPEQIRLTVTAADTAERDALTRQFTAQLTSAHAENLAHRKPRAAMHGRSVGAFYIEGKQGINYNNPKEKQVLVRLPVDQAQAIIDSVSSGVRSPKDQLALQAGPVRAQGPEKSQKLIELLAQKDGTEPAKPGKVNDFDDVALRTPKVNLVDTLGEIVGLGPIAANSLDGNTKSNEAEESDVSAAVSAERVASADTNESKKELPPSLVEKRFERARTASRSTPSATVSAGSAARPPEGPEKAPAHRDQFVTMVVEFALPKPKESIRSR